MSVTWRPEAEVIRKAVENTKRLGEILEPSSDQSKTHLTKQVRSTWLTAVEEVITAIKKDFGYIST